MKMQNVEMEFVTFDAQDVIATSGPLPGYTKVGTYYIGYWYNEGVEAGYALYEDGKEYPEFAPQGIDEKTGFRTAHQTAMEDTTLYTNAEHTTFDNFLPACESGARYEFWQASNDLYCWLKQVNQ